MTNEINKKHIVNWLRVTANEIERNEEYLTQLDAAIGDAEHGLSMNRGFKKVASQMEALKEKDIGSILKSVGIIGPVLSFVLDIHINCPNLFALEPRRDVNKLQFLQPLHPAINNVEREENVLEAGDDK